MNIGLQRVGTLALGGQQLGLGAKADENWDSRGFSSCQQELEMCLGLFKPRFLLKQGILSNLIVGQQNQVALNMPLW